MSSESPRISSTLIYSTSSQAWKLRYGRSSSTSQTLAQLASSLDSLEAAYAAYAPSTEQPIPSAPLSRHQSRISTAPESSQKTSAPEPDVKSITAVAEPATSIRQRKPRTGPSLSAYLAKREREDAQGGEAGLLPVSLPRVGNGGDRNGVDAEKQREELLAGNTSRAALSGAQLHEELGGQLAQVRVFYHGNATGIRRASTDLTTVDVEPAQAERAALCKLARRGKGDSRNFTSGTGGYVMPPLLLFPFRSS